MSEDTTTEQAPAPLGKKWGDPIDETHKKDLWARLSAWWEETDHGERKGPFAGERLTGAGVFWLAVCALAKQGGTVAVQAEGSLRAAQDDVILSIFLDLSMLDLGGAYLGGAQLQGAALTGAQMKGAYLNNAQMQGAYLNGAQMQGAYLNGAQLERVSLIGAQLERAHLNRAQLEGANLDGADLSHADLRQASLDKKTVLKDAILTDVLLDGVIVDNTNLSVVEWTVVPRLQDERLAQQARFGEEERDKNKRGKRKPYVTRKDEYQAAARAYRRLVVALQANGMSEEAAGYAYRAQLMQREVYRYSGWGSLGQWLFSWFLWVIAGYGYRPGRSVVLYLGSVALFGVVLYLGSVALFAVGYYLLGVTVGPHLSPYEAAVVSLTAFHGRGFFATAFQPGDPQAGLAALEAVFGLLIEITFIATFTQRFFGAK